MPNSLIYLCCPPGERRATEAVFGAAGLQPRWVDDAPSVLAALDRRQSVVLADFGDPRTAPIVSEVKRARPSAVVLAVADPQRAAAQAEVDRSGIPAVLRRPLNPRMFSLLLGGRAEGALPRAIAAHQPGAPIIARSAAMRRTLDAVERAADTPSGVLLCGEHGSGRAMLAREIHERGADPAAPFVKVDCSGGGGDALEAFLFGAIGRDEAAGGERRGIERVSRESALALARGGTLFLAGLTDLSGRVQARLSRALRDGEVVVGEARAPVALGLRPVASSTPDWDDAVAEGGIRADLARRLAPTRVDVPSLRDRREDLPLLSACLLDQLCRRQGLGPRALDSAALALLAALPWRGNGPELEAVLATLSRAASGPAIGIDHVLAAVDLDGAGRKPVPTGTLREARAGFERDYITAVLDQHRGRVPEAARALGIQRTNLYRKMRLLRIAWRGRDGSGHDAAGGWDAAGWEGSGPDGR